MHDDGRGETTRDKGTPRGGDGARKAPRETGFEGERGVGGRQTRDRVRAHARRTSPHLTNTRTSPPASPYRGRTHGLPQRAAGSIEAAHIHHEAARGSAGPNGATGVFPKVDVSNTHEFHPKLKTRNHQLSRYMKLICSESP